MNPLELLSGDSETFISEVWGRRTLVHQVDPAALADVFGIDHADHLITSAGLRTPQVRLAQDGKVLDQARYVRQAAIAGQPLTGLLDTRKVLALFDAGATIVFQGLHRYWEPLRLLIRGLEADLGHPCQANAYLTPPGSQGFAVHADPHDVFTFQTFGTKEWEVHVDGEPRQVMMRPGTSLYLPTGTPHAARTQDTASLHVTVGIKRTVWADVLRDVATRAIAADDTAAEPLPAGLFRDPDALAAAVAARLAGLAAGLTATDTTAVVERLETTFETQRQPVLIGALRDLLDVRELTPDTALRRRPGTTCTLRERDDKLDLLLGDRILTVPAGAAPAVRFVLARPDLRPADVPLDADSARVLCRRLVREGLLEVVR